MPLKAEGCLRRRVESFRDLGSGFRVFEIFRGGGGAVASFLYFFSLEGTGSKSRRHPPVFGPS